MAMPVSEYLQSLPAILQKRKRMLLGIAGAIALYALLGFFLTPWLVKKTAINAVGENLNAELRLEKVAINPFVLSLRIDGLELDSATGEPVARIQQIYTNFQLSSLFRWAWSFDEIRFDAPELFVARDTAGALNLASLPRARQSAERESIPDEPSGMPRLYIFDFAINDARVDWRDSVPPEPVETLFGPVSIRIAELNTLPERAGEQEVVITTESQGTLSWAGSLQLNPLMSSGHATVRGSHFPLASAYLRHETGLDVIDGEADISLDYSIETGAGGELTAAVDNLELLFSGIRVNTFHAEPDDKKQPREFLSIPRISLTGGTLRWPDREVSASNFEIGDGVLGLVRLDDGAFDFATTSTTQTSTPEENTTDAAPESLPWRLSLDRFAITNFDVSLTDYSVTPVANTGLNAIALQLQSISNQPGTAFPTTLSMTGEHGGTINLNGSVTALPRPILDFDVSVGGLSLGAAHPYLKPLADVNLDSGTLAMNGKIRHNAEDPLLFTSDITISDFLITETDEGTRLGSWSRLLAESFELSIAGKTVEVSEVRLEQPYGDILIAADGSVNLGRVSRADTSEEGPPAAPEPADAGNPMTVTIGRVIINDAAADFADQSLPLPFAAKIAEMNGTLSTISTGSVEPSNVNLEGKVDEFGLVRVTGFVTPLDVPRNTDLAVVFENVEMPKFSAYTIPFAGREIASGKLDLDLGYEVKQRQLAGENRIVLRDFELGDEVEHPGAMSLPLGLAVALLKDPSGKIDIDLPVRGDLDDPDFGYGRVIGKALVNLIVKIVASPFALLGNLVGAEADELEYINFPAGRDDLTPPEIERTQKIAEALSQRPELVLEISGVIDREADALAIKTARLDEAVETRIESDSSNDDATYSEQRAEVIEDMYREMTGADETQLSALRARFLMTIVDAESGEESGVFDSLAYTEDLRRQLIEAAEVTEPELVALARQRAANASESVLSTRPELEGRVRVIDLREEDARASDDVVRMKVSITTD